MKQDCTVSLTTADETKSFQTSENAGFPEGTCVSEPDKQTGSEVEKCTGAKTETGIKATEIQDLSLSLDGKRIIRSRHKSKQKDTIP